MKISGKPLRKKSDPKNRKNSKNQIEIAACEQKIHERESEILFKHSFSHSFNSAAKKKFTPKPLAFRSTYCFSLTKINTPI